MKLEIERKWLIGGGIAAAALVAVVLVAWLVKSIDIPLVGNGGSTPAQAQAHSDLGDEVMAEEQEAAETDLGRCVAIWNRPTNGYGRSLISGYSDQPPYVNVSFSATFPDKCLITAANADLGRAFQFLEGGQASGEGEGESELGPFGLPISEGSVNSLPPSVTQWNVSADSEGYLSLNS